MSFGSHDTFCAGNASLHTKLLRHYTASIVDYISLSPLFEVAPGVVARVSGGHIVESVLVVFARAREDNEYRF